MNSKNLGLPIAIVIAGIIIACAIYYTNTTKSNNNQAAVGQVPPTQEQVNGPKAIAGADHVLGNPDATLTFFLFTDFECPFCKIFNDATKQMIEEYVKPGKVRLVFRHLPLDSLHQKSRKEAEASECAAFIGGEDKFWQFVNRIFEVTPSNDGLDPTQLPKIAAYIGVDKDKFNECLNNGKFATKVQEDYQDAVASGGNGTPYFVIVNKSGEKFPVSGALPYQELKLGLDQLLGQASTTKQKTGQ